MSASEAVSVHRQAADWFARKRSGAMTVHEAAELHAWLAASADHQMAFDSVELMWAASEAIRHEPAVLEIREEALKAGRPGRRVAAFAALAASLSALVVTGAVYTSQHNALTPGPRTFSTSPGQTTTITLPDGSKVTLDADTVVRAHETRARRSLDLIKGRAFFRVAKDPSRPFVVAARDKTVTAVGTAFDVALQPNGVRVTLLEGKVKVDAPAAAPSPLAPPAPPVDGDDRRLAAHGAGRRLVAGGQGGRGRGGQLGRRPARLRRPVAGAGGRGAEPPLRQEDRHRRPGRRPRRDQRQFRLRRRRRFRPRGRGLRPGACGARDAGPRGTGRAMSHDIFP